MSTPAEGSEEAEQGKPERSGAAARHQRFSFRVPTHIKERIDQAAAYRGMSVTQFVLSTVTEEATRTIERHNRFELDAEASRRFVEVLSGPGRSRQELVDLFQT